MKRYKVSVPRVACAIVALIMATIAVCLLGILPSIESQSQTLVTMTATKASTTTQCDGANSSAYVVPEPDSPQRRQSRRS